MRYVPNSDSALILTLLLFVHVTPAQIPEHRALQTGSDCSSCHANKTSGKSLHAAVETGCASCHQVVSDGTNVTVRLKMAKAQLCFACHLRSGDAYLHEPYAKGRCVSCHDPHSSDYPVHLRAEASTLCLRCHAPKGLQKNLETAVREQPPPTSDPPAPSSSPFDAALQTIHGTAQSFLTMISALPGRNQPVLCTTCHEPHGSRQSKLLRNPIGPGL